MNQWRSWAAGLKPFYGFTLLEVIIALLILAIIAVIGVTGLQAVISSHNQTTPYSERLEALQMARLQMERDMIQMIGEPLIDQTGTQITFMGNGYTNPFAIEARSTLQFVEYALQETQLVRTTWQTPELGVEQDSSHRALLEDIARLEIYPLIKPVTDELSAIEVKLTFSNGEMLTWDFLVEGEPVDLP